MAKPYSLDLRIRVIENLKDASMTQLEVADTFRISLRTIKRWVKINKRNGSVEPKKVLVTKPRKVDYLKAKNFIEKNPDKTLKEIGDYIGTKNVIYVIKKLNITYKKTLPLRGKTGRFETRISRNSKKYSKRKSNLS